MISAGADVIVEVALRHEPKDRSRIVRELCRGDEALESLALALLAGLERPEVPLPQGPFPVELGPFTLERELGAGAHGKVYLARRRPLDGYVALKIMRPGPGMSAFVEQVRREAGRARRIPSAHVVPVFDAGRIEGGPFYVEMAVCADPDEASPGSIRIGRSLHDERSGLTPREAARLVEDLASAVQAAHRTGVVHGDLKPENVLVTPETRRVMLADFGLATSLAAVTEKAASTPVGTIAYMAPEQWHDLLAPSESSDVYGLGGTLYFLLSGVPPHPGRERGEDLPIAPLPQSVPQRLREIVQRALSPHPTDRPSSAGALAEELRRFRDNEPTFHDRKSLGRRFVLFARRHLRELAAVSAVLAVLLPLGVAGYHGFTGQLTDLSRREALLRAHIDDLERARLALERETARLEGEADAKQKELARVEERLRLLPKMDQALGAARAAAESAEQTAKEREESERKALERAASLEASLSTAREAFAQAVAREGSALRDAGRMAGELAEVRAHLASAIAEADAVRRDGQEKRAALEAELRDKIAQLATLKAGRLASEPSAAGAGASATPAAGQGAQAVRVRKVPLAEGAQEPKKAPEPNPPAHP